MTSERWSEEQTKLALYLYLQLPYGKLHKGNPEIRVLAEYLGRTPSSVAMKLSNFASMDPVVLKTGRKGLSGASQLDKLVFQNFASNWTSLVAEVEPLWTRISTPISASKFEDVASSSEYKPYEGPTSVERFQTTRVGQSFFRRAVLANFDGRCCVTGISEHRLINTSHIKPWAADIENRHNPANGLALSATFDRAFDRGLMTICASGRISLSDQLMIQGSEKTHQYFSKYERAQIELPKRFPLNSEFLEWHRDVVFQG